MRVFFIILMATLCNRSEAQFWGAKAPRPIDTPKDSLKRGDFTWAPELSPEGPIVVTVNLDDQFAYTYRNGLLIGVATVSTGKPGHQTPTGVFVTTYKDAKHRSSKYNNAPMPFTQRFTSSGIALHAGGIPNYPSSHGCVHLPSEYARLLYKESPLGMTVVVTDKSKNPVEVSHPSFLNPVYTDGKMQPHERLSEKEAYRWNPDRSLNGPVSMVISGADERLVVLRNGVEIGRCKIAIANEQDSLGTHFYVAQEDETATSSMNNSMQINWLAMPLQDLRYDKTTSHPFIEDRIRIPDAFLKELAMVLVPGTHILVTDAPILAGSTGKKMAIVSSYPKGVK
ncbi:MAG TPA: L,D-transpeptidase [Chitinophagaceae bacterium]|nr:L,D-transpeptidase [Chitinophagaceae bacterium]